MPLVLPSGRMDAALAEPLQQVQLPADFFSHLLRSLGADCGSLRPEMKQQRPAVVEALWVVAQPRSGGSEYSRPWLEPAGVA